MKINLYKDLSKFIFLLIFILFFFQNEILVQDTYSYIENIYKRPFLYPFLINIFQILSENNYLKYLSILQLILGYLSIIFFSFFFIKKFKINNILNQVILIFSISFPYLGISMKLGLTIFSESIGYPLLLIFCIYFLKHYFYPKANKNKKYFFLVIFLFCLMVLNKKTFLFVLPLIFLGEIIFFLLKKNIKKLILNLLIVLLSVIIINLAERTNTYFKTGLFKNISVSGSSFLTGPFYLASDRDLENVEGIENNRIISFAINEFSKHKIERNMLVKADNDILSFSKNNRKIFSHYFNQYVQMQDFFENKINYPSFYGINSENQLLVRQLSSKHCTDIAIQLIKMKPKENLLFYISNVLYGMGGYFISRDDLKGFYANVGFSGYYILILKIILAVVCIFTLFDRDKNKKIAMIILFFITLNFSNILATALYQPVYDRFSFLTFQFIFFVITLIFVNFINSRSNNT